MRTTGSPAALEGVVDSDIVGVPCVDASGVACVELGKETAVKVHRPNAQLRIYRPGMPGLGGDAAFSPVDAEGASKQ